MSNDEKPGHPETPNPLPRTATPQELADRILTGDRAALARGITLIESTQPRQRAAAQELIDRLQPHAGAAIRVGLTGVPGVGKSTTIDQLGSNLIADGQRVAVLAVDPTSKRSGGSILGDKTRMAQLSVDNRAFVRPSPTSGTLGGVTRRTRETMVLVEAAGFDVVIVETVGVGQSETAVADMVDIFVVLLLPGGGDDLQGIKKGVIELAELVAINKADGEMRARAERTAADYRAALHLLQPAHPDWTPPVLTMSGLTNDGLDQLWQHIAQHQALMHRTGSHAARRRAQAVAWMDELLGDTMRERLLGQDAVRDAHRAARADVAAGTLAPGRAVDRILEAAGLVA